MPSAISSSTLSSAPPSAQNSFRLSRLGIHSRLLAFASAVCSLLSAVADGIPREVATLPSEIVSVNPPGPRPLPPDVSDPTHVR